MSDGVSLKRYDVRSESACPRRIRLINTSGLRVEDEEELFDRSIIRMYAVEECESRLGPS